MSLPVPLSPSINIGTDVLATFSKLARSDCMASERPKTIDSGGTLPFKLAPTRVDDIELFRGMKLSCTLHMVGHFQSTTLLTKVICRSNYHQLNSLHFFMNETD